MAYLSGGYINEDCADISDWTDADSGAGAASTQATFDSKSCMKLDSGNAGSYAERYKDPGSLSNNFSFELSLYASALGTNANYDALQVQVCNGVINFVVKWASDGLFVFDGDIFNEVGIDLVTIGRWETWGFCVTGGNAATATADVYKAVGSKFVKVGNAVDCSYASSSNDGMVLLYQFGTTTANRISYIDYILVDDNVLTAPTLWGISKYNGLSLANIVKINGVDVSGIGKINGIA